MGLNGSTLVGKASVNGRLLPFTTWGRQEVLSMRSRHFHDLGGRFALSPRQFAVLLNVPDQDAAELFRDIFDTDKNNLVDALEIMGCFVMISTMTIKEKVDFVHSLYDFNNSGDISIDELTIMMRTLASGCGKIDGQVEVPPVLQFEELALWAFSSAGVELDGEFPKHEFDAFCGTNPNVQAFLEYWTGANNQVVMQSGERWSDPYFPAQAASIYEDPLRPPLGMMPGDTVRWLRAQQFCPDTPKLFTEGSDGPPGDIVPGHLATRWFVNAMALVASAPEVLRGLFESNGQESQGRFTVKFFKEERWAMITTDDRIPCDVLGRVLVTKSADPNVLWPMLMEKAYAKLHKCYENIIHGTTTYALRDLTGGTTERLDLHSKKVQSMLAGGEFFNMLKNSLRAGQLVGAMWQTERPEAVLTGGLMMGCKRQAMYSLLQVVESKGVKLLKLQNHWGGAAFDGEWSPKSDKWVTASPDVMEKTKYKPKAPEPGVFWIKLGDFLEVFDTLYLVNLHASQGKSVWSHQYRESMFPLQGGGSANHESWVKNPQFFLEVKEKCVADITVTQKDALFHGPSTPDPVPVGVCVVKHEWGEPKATFPCEKLLQPDLVGVSTPFTAGRDHTLRVEMEAGKYAVIPMRFNPPGETEVAQAMMVAEQEYDEPKGRPFWLSVVSLAPVHPLTLLSGKEVMLADPQNLRDEGVMELEAECTEAPAVAAQVDPEPENETVALEALSQLVGELWATARQLEIRRAALSAAVEQLEGS